MNYPKVNSTVVLENTAAGQAYFIRSLCYYFEVRTFGEIPIITTKLNVDDRPPRKPVEKVYDFIISDLKKAIELLPVSKPSGKLGYANKWAAHSLLTDVYLTMTG